MSSRRFIAPGATLALLVLGTSAAQAACYTVLDAKGVAIYRAQTPPVDMSLPLHETLPLVAPGGALVFTLGNDGCELQFNRLPVAATAPAALPPSAPLPAARRAPMPDRG